MIRLVSYVFIAVVLLTGCSSVSVNRLQGIEKPSAPRRLYVQEFTASAEVFRVDRSSHDLRKFRETMARRLAEATTTRATKRLIPAVARPRSAAVPRERAWLVTGRFVRVNQGSRALRTAVGFGLGGTKLETEVVVYDLDHRQPREILRFYTTGGSNALPGVLPGMIVPNFWLIGLDTLIKVGPGLSNDTIRTSRQIVAVLSEYMAREGFLPPKRIYRAKQLGKWP